MGELPRIESSRTPEESPDTGTGDAATSDDSGVAGSDASQPGTLNGSGNGSGNGFAIAIATAGGAGFIPGAPGTFGALVGVLLFLPLSHLSLGMFGLTLLALCALGIWVSDRAEFHFGRKDDGRIVIDEVAGVLINLAPLVPLRGLPLPDLGLGGLVPGWMAGNEAFFALVVTGFVLFRVFDIRKPGPVHWAERRFSGGFGVMADDIVAGVLGAVVLTVPAYVLVLMELTS